MTGGYTVNENLTAAALPADAQNAFDKALTGLTGTSYTPIVLLGTQIVSGTNYVILCKVTPVVPDPVSELDVVTIHEDLDSNAEILSTVPFDLSEVTNTDHTYTETNAVPDGFVTNTEFTPQPNDDHGTAAFFNQNSSDENSVSYQYAAELGTQSAAGTNHAFLALKTDGDKNVWTVLTVFEDLYGDGSLSSVYELDPGAYTEYGQNSTAADNK